MAFLIKYKLNQPKEENEKDMVKHKQRIYKQFVGLVSCSKSFETEKFDSLSSNYQHQNTVQRNLFGISLDWD